MSEVPFGLIMVLTFTGSLSVAEAGQAEVRTMLIGALGCNLAWGLIDGLFYLMRCLAEKGRGLATVHEVRRTEDREKTQRLISHALPPFVVSLLEPPQLEAMRMQLIELPEPPRIPRLEGEEWRGGLGGLLLVCASTFPVVVPFLLVSDPHSALRLSNIVAIAMLFLCGYMFGRLTRYHPWWTGLGMVLVGSLLVTLTIALGG